MATDKVDVTYVATRLALRAALTLIPPSNVNVTVPVGVPAPGEVAVTIAVNVIGWPKTVGVAEVANPVVVLARLTTWLIELVLPLKFVSPPYVAVTGCVTTLSVDVT